MVKSFVFYRQLRSVVKTYNDETIKDTIGDSTINNRVPSVNQLIRFLRTKGGTSNLRLARQLGRVFVYLKGDMGFLRRINNKRTDAYDVNEFARAFLANYETDSRFNRKIAQILK